VGSRVLLQGSDPATDLRGVGFLGLVQVLYLVMTPELLPFARDVYALSRKEDQVNSEYELYTRLLSYFVLQTGISLLEIL
jgi:hypothetical protein